MFPSPGNRRQESESSSWSITRSCFLSFLFLSVTKHKPLPPCNELACRSCAYPLNVREPPNYHPSRHSPGSRSIITLRVTQDRQCPLRHPDLASLWPTVQTTALVGLVSNPQVNGAAAKALFGTVAVQGVFLVCSVGRRGV